MYQIYVRSNVYLEDETPLEVIGERDEEGKFMDENILECELHEGPSDSRPKMKIKLNEMTANETIDYLANLLETWSRISVEWNEV